jgi:hypothetical protein
MRVVRVIIIPAIVALSAAGSILASSAMPAVAAQAPSAHVLSTNHSASPDVYYNG